jgi:tRNA (mo5U34)-methyltransferase
VNEAQAAVDAHPHWYHTMEVAPGVVTPGWFDLRPTLDAMPWPDVAGKRCLDVGTYDGQLAFELERRGASEVIATDVAGHEDWDWPVRIRDRGIAALQAGPPKGRGFEIARDLLGSSARREPISIYELSPERLGEFDVVVCGSLLLHLREPLRALMAIRSVCRGKFLSAETIIPGEGEPAAKLDGLSDLCQWWTPNRAGHRRMVESAGFEIEQASDAYEIRLGPAHPPPPRKIFSRRKGILHAAVLARPL